MFWILWMSFCCFEKLPIGSSINFYSSRHIFNQRKSNLSTVTENCMHNYNSCTRISYFILIVGSIYFKVASGTQHLDGAPPTHFFLKFTCKKYIPLHPRIRIFMNCELLIFFIACLSRFLGWIWPLHYKKKEDSTCLGMTHQS